MVYLAFSPRAGAKSSELQERQIVIKGRANTKANNNEIRIHPSLWKMIHKTVEQWKKDAKRSGWWIGPNDEAQAFQSAVAWAAKAGLEKYGDLPVKVAIRLINQSTDVDGPAKAILDGLQDAGTITNDRQVVELHIVKIRTGDREGPRTTVAVYPANALPANAPTITTRLEEP